MQVERFTVWGVEGFNHVVGRHFQTGRAGKDEGDSSTTAQSRAYVVEKQ